MVLVEDEGATLSDLLAAVRLLQEGETLRTDHTAEDSGGCVAAAAEILGGGSWPGLLLGVFGLDDGQYAGCFFTAIAVFDEVA